MSGRHPQGCGEEGGDWLDERLVARALEGLDADAEAELCSLLNADEVDHGHYEEAAACYWRGAGDPPRPMPPDVAARLERRFAPDPASDPGQTRSAAAPRPPVSPVAGWAALRGRHGRLGAGLAAGLALLAASAVWLPMGDDISAPSRAELAAARTELMQSAPDAVRLDWKAGPADAGASGYVVWSEARQHGYMTVRDIPPNDPAEYRYRAWLFGGGATGSPISVGVFNAPEDAGEVIVPIRNRVPVHEVDRFGITRESADAARYTDDERLLLLAQPSAGNH